jgi:hypothetical protein
MTITEQPSTSAKWDPTDHPLGRDPFLAAFESSKAPSSPIIPSVALWGPVCIGLPQLMFPFDVRAQSGKGGTESKLQSSNRGLDAAYRGLNVARRGTKSSTRKNARGEHSYVM